MDANLALGFAADERTFLTAAAMLRDLGLRRDPVADEQPREAGRTGGARNRRGRPRQPALRGQMA